MTDENVREMSDAALETYLCYDDECEECEPYTDEIDRRAGVGVTTGGDQSDDVYVDANTGNFEDAYSGLVGQMLRIAKAKRNDYTGNSEDRLKNYRQGGKLLNLSAHQVMVLRINEKVQRVAVLLGDTKREVSDETIEDTLVDIANIALLIAASRKTGDDGN